MYSNIVHIWKFKFVKELWKFSRSSSTWNLGILILKTFTYLENFIQSFFGNAKFLFLERHRTVINKFYTKGIFSVHHQISPIISTGFCKIHLILKALLFLTRKCIQGLCLNWAAWLLKTSISNWSNYKNLYCGA